jgi:hypothetical protein
MQDRQLRGEERCSVGKPSSNLRISWPTFISAKLISALG